MTNENLWKSLFLEETLKYYFSVRPEKKYVYLLKKNEKSKEIHCNFGSHWTYVFPFQCFYVEKDFIYRLLPA